MIDKNTCQAIVTKDSPAVCTFAYTNPGMGGFASDFNVNFNKGWFKW